MKHCQKCGKSHYVRTIETVVERTYKDGKQIAYNVSSGYCTNILYSCLECNYIWMYDEENNQIPFVMEE